MPSLPRVRARRMQARLPPACLPGSAGEGRVKEPAKRPRPLPPPAPLAGAVKGFCGPFTRRRPARQPPRRLSGRGSFPTRAACRGWQSSRPRGEGPSRYLAILGREPPLPGDRALYLRMSSRHREVAPRGPPRAILGDTWRGAGLPTGAPTSLVGPCRTSPEARPAPARDRGACPPPPRRSARWCPGRLRSSFGALRSSAGRATDSGTRQVTGGGTVCLPLPVRTQGEVPAP